MMGAAFGAAAGASPWWVGAIMATGGLGIAYSQGGWQAVGDALAAMAGAFVGGMIVYGAVSLADSSEVLAQGGPEGACANCESKEATFPGAEKQAGSLSDLMGEPARVTTEYGGTTPKTSSHSGLDVTGNPHSQYGDAIRATKSGWIWKGATDPEGTVVFQPERTNYTAPISHIRHALNAPPSGGPGLYVAKEQVIGYISNTGFTTGPHVHIELWYNGLQYNPRLVFTP